MTCPYCGRPDAGMLCDDDHCREPGGPLEVPVTREDFLPDGEPAEKDLPF